MHQSGEPTRESIRIENYPDVKAKPKTKRINFCYYAQFSLWRGIRKGPAFRYKSEKLLQNQKSAKEIFRTNFYN